MPMLWNCATTVFGTSAHKYTRFWTSSAWIGMLWLLNTILQEWVVLWYSELAHLIVWCEIANRRQRWFALTEVVINTKYNTQAQKACLLKFTVLISQGRREQWWSRGGSRAPNLSFFSHSCQVRASSCRWKWCHVKSKEIGCKPLLICSATDMS